jgi:hypothetical protein
MGFVYVVVFVDITVLSIIYFMTTTAAASHHDVCNLPSAACRTTARWASTATGTHTVTATATSTRMRRCQGQGHGGTTIGAS